MAQAAFLVDRDQFSCSICLDLLKDPVTIPCGHSYCLDCIKGCWDKDEHTGVYGCPQCRDTFTPRPVMKKNTLLDEVVAKLKKTGLQAAPPAHGYSGSAGVSCDFCIEGKCEAIKSCLVCLASYCETHLQAHYESPALKNHNLVKATVNLMEKICSRHGKQLEIYCRKDQQFICYLCTIEDHRSHETVLVATERMEKQEKLGKIQGKFQQRIQQRENELKDLKRTLQSLKRSAQTAVEDSERFFSELIRSTERRQIEVKELIRDLEETEVRQTEGLLERIEQEIAELRRRDAELEQLAHTGDHIHFLQISKHLYVPPGPGDLPCITVSPHNSIEAVRKCVFKLQQRLEDVCQGEMSKISAAGRAVGSSSETGEEGMCLLCMKPWKDKLSLMCTHAFCEACLYASVCSVGLQCPLCLTALTVVGNQPEGQMTVKQIKDLFGKECFCITYNIPGGIQTEAHPNPGKPFTGIQITAYFPDHPRLKEPKEVLKRLERAFHQKLVFTIAATGGAEDRVVFTSIPHARTLYECRKYEFLESVKRALNCRDWVKTSDPPN